MRRKLGVCVAVLLAGLSASAALAGEWQMKRAPVMTKFAADVRPDNAWREYPRPQMARAEWQNLNGLWEFQAGLAGDATPPPGQKLLNQILVPYPVESALSGVMEHHAHMWYRRTFSVPSGWAGKRTLLHFGAVDFETEVFVNGKSVGTHKGGYDPFTFDVTDALRSGGTQEVLVKVADPTDDGGQPRGKQSLRPGGIMYTPTSGIWQTVWLEPVSSVGIDHLKITPDVDAGAVHVTAVPVGNAGDATVTAIVRDGDRVVTKVVGKPGAKMDIAVPDAKLWSPESPFLYDLELIVVDGAGKTVDRVTSYFGMRKIELGTVDGVKKMLLNGKFVFEIGPLDQGFWPDGIYTPPSEAAVKYDLQTMKDLGFNMVRKHIKVEPLRWYYWADHMGLLVWQDMPSPNSYTEHTPPVDVPQFELELRRMVANLENVPSIIMWDVFNEGQAQHDTKKLVALVKQLDPTRLVNQASGGGYDDAGDVFDIHSYPPPGCPDPNDHMALACGEYGGIAFKVPGHMYRPDGGGYIDAPDPAGLVDMYAEYSAMLRDFRDKRGLSAAVYTQITDVETEINGLLTYDRIPKMDVKQIARANRFEIPAPTYVPVLATSEQQPQPARYTTDNPGAGWAKRDLDDANWKQGNGGFGSPGTPNIGQLGTEWTGSDIWIRRTFTPGQMTPDQLKALMVRVYHDEDVEVYLNGVLAFRAGGFNGRYENARIFPDALKALDPTGKNVLAAHCKQTVGGQYLDVGLVRRESGVK